MDHSPKSGWLLIVSAVLVIAQAILWFAAMLSFAVLDAQFIPLAAVAVAVSCAIGLSQYNAIIRRRPGSANFVSVALILLTIPSMLPVMLILAASDSLRLEGVLDACLLYAPVFVIGQNVAASVLNQRWAERLTVVTAAGALPTTPGYTLRDMFALTTLVAVAMGLASWIVRSSAWQASFQ